MQLNKSIEQWLRCDPRSMAKMSEGGVIIGVAIWAAVLIIFL